MLYANVHGLKSLPTKGLRGVCPACGESVTAKCGAIVTHHWSHLAGSECDPWAEKIGPWHLSWQNLVEADSVEVVLAPHRADIMGNDDVVVELQHSAISAEDIAAREAFYGNMVWLFDATERFDLLNTGRRTFFSFLRTKHIPLCAKPVFLDFGGMIVEVESFTVWDDADAGLVCRPIPVEQAAAGGRRSLSHGPQSSVDPPPAL